MPASIAARGALTAVLAVLALPAPAGAVAGWERTWGRDVVAGAPFAFEICTLAVDCKYGVSHGLGGEIQGAQGIALDPAGNVYVTEFANRVSKFDASGDFVRAWGMDVVIGGGFGFEICTVAAECKQGPAGGLGGQMGQPREIAVDATTSDVYVVDSTGRRIQRFDADGNFERAWGKNVVQTGGTGFEICTATADCRVGEAGGLAGEFSSPVGVAVDASGDVYVTDEGNHRVQRFDADGNFERAWGRDVDGAAAGTGFEVCTTAADCKAGIAGGLGGEMNAPHGIAVQPTGDVFVADHDSHRIQRFDQDGAWERAWGKDVVTGGATDFEVCTTAGDCQTGAVGGLGGEMNQPRGVGVDAASNVYVVEEELGRVQRFDVDGGWERLWGEDVVVPPGVGFEICTVAADCKATPGGSTGGAMLFPADVAIDGSGNVRVADDGNSRVQTFDTDGDWVRTWGRDVIAGGTRDFEICEGDPAACRNGALGIGGEFNGPRDVAADATGDVVVTDLGYSRVQRFSASGGFERMWGLDVIEGPGPTGFEVCTVPSSCRAPPPSSVAGAFAGPLGIATDASGNVYVADSGNRRIQKFAAAGTWLRAWGKDVVAGGGTGFEICTLAAACKVGASGGEGGAMAQPVGVTVDGAGSVYVTEDGNHRVQRFDSSGNWQRAWGKDVVDGGGTGFEVCTVAASCKAGALGTLGGELRVPDGIAADAAGNVYVADQVNRRIQRYDALGTWDRAWGQDVDAVTPGTGFEVCTTAADCKEAPIAGDLGGEMSFPAGLETDGEGNVYVADPGDHRVQRFMPDGTWVRAWGKDVDAADPGTAFEVCEVAADCQAGTPGVLAGELFQPEGVAVDPAGNVLVADAYNQRVQKFAEFAEPAPPAPPDDDDGGGGGDDAAPPDDVAPPADGLVPPPGGTGPIAGPLPDRVPPVIASVRVTSRFAPLRRPRAVTARRVRRGARIAISVSEPADLVMRVQRARPGRRRGRRCVAPVRAPRGRRCARWASAGSVRARVAAGLTRLRFSGWVGGRRLRRGRYRLLVTATDAAGNRSRARASNRFRVTRTRR